MKNKFRLKNKFKNKQLKSQMDRFRKMLLKDIEEIQKKPKQRAESKGEYSYF